jgi:hypothetical protein
MPSDQSAAPARILSIADRPIVNYKAVLYKVVHTHCVTKFFTCESLVFNTVFNTFSIADCLKSARVTQNITLHYSILMSTYFYIISVVVYKATYTVIVHFLTTFCN